MIKAVPDLREIESPSMVRVYRELPDGSRGELLRVERVREVPYKPNNHRYFGGNNGM